jgi:hypothetical protein
MNSKLDKMKEAVAPASFLRHSPSAAQTPYSFPAEYNNPFNDHRIACLAVLNSGCKLTRKDGQFLGGQAFDDAPLSFKQAKWLKGLLERAELPSFAV